MGGALYHRIISVENLLLAWQEFIRGKRNKKDVQEFSLRLIDNILSLHQELTQQTYQHGGYHHFKISDPKPRDIHKASVRDRLVHHAVYRVLYPYFSKRFIADSFSCQLNKGTHKALDRFRAFAYKVSKNHTRTCWVLKCDIKKFFASIDHDILYPLFAERQIGGMGTLWLLKNIIDSFSTENLSYLTAVRYDRFYSVTASNRSSPGMDCHGVPRNDSKKGLPLGNLTSQLLVNIYMNEFDQWVKHTLKAKYYIRYADDFVFLSEDKKQLEDFLPQIDRFLKERLKLQLHPDKVYIKSFASGVDFLGWVHFPDHRVLRTASKRRMLSRLRQHASVETTASYRGLLSRGNTHTLQQIAGLDMLPYI